MLPPLLGVEPQAAARVDQTVEVLATGVRAVSEAISPYVVRFARVVETVRAEIKPHAIRLIERAQPYLAVAHETSLELEAAKAGKLTWMPNQITRFVLFIRAAGDYFESPDFHFVLAVGDFTAPNDEPLRHYPTRSAAFAEIERVISVPGKFTRRDEFLQALRIAVFKHDSTTGEPIVLVRLFLRMKEPLLPSQQSFREMNAAIRYIAHLTKQEMTARQFADSAVEEDADVNDLEAFLKAVPAKMTRVAKHLKICPRYLYRVLARERAMSAGLRQRIREFLADPPWTIFTKKHQKLLEEHRPKSVALSRLRGPEQLSGPIQGKDHAYHQSFVRNCPD